MARTKRKQTFTPAPTPAPRQDEIWQYPLPETENVIQDGDGPLGRVLGGLDSFAADLDGSDRDRALSILAYARQLATQAAEGAREVDALRAHAQQLVEACADLADRVAECDEIRDAIERYPHTAPDVWRQALACVRNGAPLRDMWSGGKS
jgi:hypothetical protein